MPAERHKRVQTPLQTVSTRCGPQCRVRTSNQLPAHLSLSIYIVQTRVAAEYLLRTQIPMTVRGISDHWTERR